jgi:SLOG cluster4 family
MTGDWLVSHGPVGVGIEVMTYVADHYAPPDFARAIGLFGHRNVVQNAEVIIVIGGGSGTQVELDLALAMRKRIIALPSSGGTARRFFNRARTDPRLRSWMSEETFAALDALAAQQPISATVEDFASIIEHLLTHETGASNA